MKSVDGQQRGARRLLIGAACTSLIVGFIACSGSTEHKVVASAMAGDGAGGNQAGAPTAHEGGSDSTPSGGQPSVIGMGGVGETTLGGSGELAAAGQATGGAGGVGGAADAGGAGGADSVGGAGGAGGESGVIDPVCGLNMVQVGAYSLWCGKVNEHLDAEGLWQPDADCTSGCNITGVSYCQKFYPSATAVVAVPQLDTKDWKNAGFISGQAGACNDSAPDGPGISGQAACCAPMP